MKLLWICSVWPEPTSSAAGVRTLQLLLAAKNAGLVVHVASPCAENSFKDQLTASGVTTEKILVNHSSFNEYIRGLGPDVVVFDRFMTEEQFSFRVKEECPDALFALDTIDLHHRRNPELKLRELASILRSDVTLVVSKVEKDYLEVNFPVSNVFHVPFWVTPMMNSPSFSHRDNMVFIGNSHHPPNREAVSFIKKEIAPKVTCEVHLYGAYTKEFQEGNVFSFGHTDDAVETLSRYRVSLAPLLSGSGIKGKVLDSFAAGTPVAATDIAAEGIGDFGVSDVLGHALELYSDKTKWSESQALGFRLLQDGFNQNLCLERFFDAINQKKSTGFIQELLWFQSLRSTEYFSRWIEQKNKVNS